MLLFIQGNFYLSMRIFRLFRVKNKNSAFFDISLFLLATFSPVLIQFAHYGTTESILAFFYTAIVYVSLLAQKSIRERDFWRYIILASFVTGIAIAAKVSSLVFCIVPLYVICARYGSQILAKLLTISKLFTKPRTKDSTLAHPPICFFPGAILDGWLFATWR